MQTNPVISPLAALEPRLRPLLPATLYAQVWSDPTPAHWMKVFDHLRTMQSILHDYVPRHVIERHTRPGMIKSEWQTGTLLFTDLVGFTPLMFANAHRGKEGASRLLGLLNDYFAAMLHIVGLSGGHLLEFTGDALLAEFRATPNRSDAACATRAGLRMQRAMADFAHIETAEGEKPLSLQMRVGIHSGRFLTAKIGTPFRMDHVLLGQTVLRAKRAESFGVSGRVNLSPEVLPHIEGQFHTEPGQQGHVLVIDDLTDEQLGAYDILPVGYRLPRALLFDRRLEGLTQSINEALDNVEPLACYLPAAILKLLVEHADRRRIPPDFPQATVMFINLVGLAEQVEGDNEPDVPAVVETFSRLFALINAAVEARGGMLKKVTYHIIGSDVMICFGVPDSHTNDPQRAAAAALAIREIVAQVSAETASADAPFACKIGMTLGPVFAAEIGESQGRREFNILAHTVNIAARLMNCAAPAQILISEALHTALGSDFTCRSLGTMAIKGLSAEQPVFELCDGPQ